MHAPPAAAGGISGMQGAAATPCPPAAAGGIHSARRHEPHANCPRRRAGPRRDQATDHHTEGRLPRGGPPGPATRSPGGGPQGPPTTHGPTATSGGVAAPNGIAAIPPPLPRPGWVGMVGSRGGAIKRREGGALVAPMTAAAYAGSSTPPRRPTCTPRGSSDHRPSRVAARREPQLAERSGARGRGP